MTTCKASFHIGTYRGRRFVDVLRTALFNYLKVNMAFTIVGGSDVDMDYFCFTDDRLTKPMQQTVKTFVAGFEASYKAF